MATGYWLVVLLVGLVSCGDTRYRGDGTFTDSGSMAANDRYVLDLGRVDARIQEGHVYQVEGLPPVEFTLGFHVDSMGPERAMKRAEEQEARVELLVTTSAGLVVFKEGGRLSNWVWGCGVDGCSTAFVYRRGTERDIPLPGGRHEAARVPGEVARAWGTYFTPQPGQGYRVQLSMAGERSFFHENDVRLLARGGGWK